MLVRFLLIAFFIAAGFAKMEKASASERRLMRESSGYGASLRMGSASDIFQRFRDNGDGGLRESRVRTFTDGRVPKKSTQFLGGPVSTFTDQYAQFLGIALISWTSTYKTTPMCTGVLIEPPKDSEDSLYVLSAASCVWGRRPKTPDQFEDISFYKVEFGVNEGTFSAAYDKKKLESPDRQICSIKDVRINHLFTTASTEAEQHAHNFAILTLNKGLTCNPSHYFSLHKATADSIYRPIIDDILHAGYGAFGNREMKSKLVTMEMAEEEGTHMMKQADAQNIRHFDVDIDNIHDTGSPYFEPVLYGQGSTQQRPYLVGIFSHMRFVQDQRTRFALRLTPKMRDEIDDYMKGTNGISMHNVLCLKNKGVKECWGECVKQKDPETMDTKCFERKSGFGLGIIGKKKTKWRKYADPLRWKMCGHEENMARYLCGEEVAQSTKEEVSTLKKAYAEFRNIFEGFDDHGEDVDDEEFWARDDE